VQNFVINGTKRRLVTPPLQYRWKIYLMILAPGFHLSTIMLLNILIHRPLVFRSFIVTSSSKTSEGY
jgi:hypothetical protein